jgi:hypothetical protein
MAQHIGNNETEAVLCSVFPKNGTCQSAT